LLVTICSCKGFYCLLWGGEGFEEPVDQVDAIDNRLEKKHKIVPKNQNWSHPPLLYNVSGLPILPLLYRKNMVVRVVKCIAVRSQALTRANVGDLKSTLTRIQVGHASKGNIK
jgi:hypothetical protein